MYTNTTEILLNYCSSVCTAVLFSKVKQWDKQIHCTHIILYCNWQSNKINVIGPNYNFNTCLCRSATMCYFPAWLFVSGLYVASGPFINTVHTEYNYIIHRNQSWLFMHCDCHPISIACLHSLYCSWDWQVSVTLTGNL